MWILAALGDARYSGSLSLRGYGVSLGQGEVIYAVSLSEG